MGRIVSLPDYGPSPRFDGDPWTSARIEGGDDPVDGPWSELATIALDPVDTDPTRPATRRLTTEIGATPPDWLRVVFVDADDDEDAPTLPVPVDSPPYSPTVADVGAILHARTYIDGTEALEGGSEAGTFTENTRPTATQVELLIRQATGELAMRVGRVIPGELIEAARHVVALRAANLVELGYYPEQTGDDRTVYQSVRLTYEEEVKALAIRVQWWVLADRLERRAAEA